MKKFYLNPEIEHVEFDEKDILTASLGDIWEKEGAAGDIDSIGWGDLIK